MKRIFTLSAILFSLYSFAQPIQVDVDTYTVEELVNDVLVASNCNILSNVSYQGASTFGGLKSIGYFTNTNPLLDMASGIILSTGSAAAAPGPNSTLQSYNTPGWVGDDQLYNYIQELGIDPGLTSYNNATVIEFDFMPTSDFISFNFVFLSEEYGTFQCSYSDAFAFFLTDLDTNETTNLAIVPGTNDPISVITIRDQAYNQSCASVNPEWFDAYFGTGGTDTNLAPLNFNGQTKKMSAESAVTPFGNYRIKLVIADRNDSSYDSAILIEAGSFDLGTVDLGEDMLIENARAICEGEDVELSVEYNEFNMYLWYFNGEYLEDEYTNSIIATEPGTYSVEVLYILSPDCIRTASIVIEEFIFPDLSPPSTLQACANPDGENTYDLTLFSTFLEGVQDGNYEAIYFLSEEDAMNNENPIANPEAYLSEESVVLWVRAENTLFSCFEVFSFTLDVYPPIELDLADTVGICGQDSVILGAPSGFQSYEWSTGATTETIEVSEVGTYTITVTDANNCTASHTYTVSEFDAPELQNQPQDIAGCSAGSAEFLFDLTANDAVLDGLGQEYVISYHTTQADAATNSNAIANPSAFAGEDGDTVYIRLYNQETTCYVILSFDLIFIDIVAGTEIPSLYSCATDGQQGTFDLNEHNEMFVIGDINNYNYSFHTSQQDAEQGTNAITNINNFSGTSQTIYVRIYLGSDAQCYQVTSFDIVVYPLIIFDQPTDVSVCSGNPITLDAPAGYLYEWSTGESTQQIIIDQPGTYTVTATDEYGCSSSHTYNVTPGIAPVVENIETGPDYLIINASGGTQPYQYSLNGTIWQPSNQFNYLQPGTYQVYVRSADGCISEMYEISIFITPTLFTPNGDGINDTFRLPQLSSTVSGQVQIYDRYGKMIYEGVTQGNEVWDGLDNRGHKVPSEDYWYIIQLSDGRKLTGHVTVKNRNMRP
ncbi:MAG: choice-of-anchor L domain-containing protein [Weeksellaceae bacterium]|nr:choice-of-anchor L domain-containing protein [Weeksellaceae bacterium]